MTCHTTQIANFTILLFAILMYKMFCFALCFLSVGQWKVQVKTSDLQGAGTHAQVMLTVYGDKGCSGPKPLGDANKKSDDFERDKLSDFTVSSFCAT